MVGFWLNQVHGRSLAHSGSWSGWIQAVVGYDLGRGRIRFRFGFRASSGMIQAVVGYDLGRGRLGFRFGFRPSSGTI